MNKKIIIPLALAPLAAPALQAQHQQPNGRTDTRPNIILFMVDDMGLARYIPAFLDPKDTLQRGIRNS